MKHAPGEGRASEPVKGNCRPNLTRNTGWLYLGACPNGCGSRAVLSPGGWIGCRDNECSNGRHFGPWFRDLLARDYPDLPLNMWKPDFVAHVRALAPTRAAGPLAPLPTPEYIAACQAALHRHRRPRRWLVDRGTSMRVAYAAGLGWDAARHEITIPLYGPDGALVAFKTRDLRPESKNLSIAGTGREWPLFVPPFLSGVGPLLICEGEWDPLCAASNGLRAVAGTLGMSNWEDRWFPQVAALAGDHPVFVVYDMGGVEYSRMVSRRLGEAGIKAHSIDLDLPVKGDDLTDYFTKYGKMTDDLRQVIRSQTKTRRKR